MIGAGAAGANAVRVAVGMGADVTVFDVNLRALAHLDEVYHGRVKTCYSEAAGDSPSRSHAPTW